MVAHAPDSGPSSSAADEALFYEGEESEGEPSDSEAHAEWTDRLPTAVELLGLASLDEVHAHGGAPVQHEFDLDRLIQLCYDGWSIEAMAEELGVPARVIRYRKTQLGLTWLVQQPWLPSRETLDEWWSLNPGITVGALAVALSVSATTLRRHMRHAGFKPSAGSGTDEEVLRAIRAIHSRKFVSKIGRTNLDGALRDEYRIVATDRQIRRAIKQIDPRGTKKRAKQAGKAQRQYRVGGPRSLYHADAHEKIAKKYGIWLHLLIDGYSRFICYLSAAPDKRAETVRRLYVTACNIVGWPSRCRWDKGTENTGARREQLNYWRSRRPDDWDKRGSVLVGRSVQNCRAEYVWRPVHDHVSGPYADRFDALAAAGDLDPSSATDLHCLHAVFLPHVQHACNRFAGMWNHRKIRGDRTVQGRGGGRPAELFNDPVGSAALMLDDQRFQERGLLYGEEVPFRDPGEPEDTDMKVESLRTEDPLGGLAVLEQVRSAYFEAHPMGGDDQAEHDYMRYKLICSELLVAFESFSSDGGLLQWADFAQSSPVYKLSCDLFLRWELGTVAIQRNLFHM